MSYPNNNNNEPFKPGDLCQLKDLTTNMNDKLCTISGPLDATEDKYPVLVLEINKTIAIKPCNLSLMDTKTIYISDMILYPIKGCKGISISSSIIDEKGIKNDRLYCLYSSKQKRVIMQTNWPKICWIEPSIPDENGIQISGPNMKHSIYIMKTYDPKTKLSIIDWTYKNQEITGYDQGDIASEWLTKYFEIHNILGNDPNDKIRLILFDPKCNRIPVPKHISVQYLNNNGNKPPIITFANEFQFLIISEESLNGLNNRIKKNNCDKNYKIKMDRFRPNIIISSNGYYEPNYEDNIKLIFVNGIKLYHTKYRNICGMPSINQQSGCVYYEPKNTLMTYRTGQKLGYLKEKKWKYASFFGSFFIHDKCGEITRGCVLNNCVSLL